MDYKDEKKDQKIDVKYVANLARLALTDEELDKFGRQLNDILQYINKLNEVDTGDTVPTSHVLDIKNVYREDAAAKSLPIEEVLGNAPAKEGNFFKVPKVIE